MSKFRNNHNNKSNSVTDTPPKRRPRYLRLTIAAASGFCVLLAACAASPEAERGYETAQEIVAQIEGSSGSGHAVESQSNDDDDGLRVAGSQCERIITTDEYGFEQEVVDCGDDLSTASTDESPTDNLTTDSVLAHNDASDQARSSTSSTSSIDSLTSARPPNPQESATSSSGSVQTPPSTSASNRGTHSSDRASTEQTSQTTTTTPIGTNLPNSTQAAPIKIDDVIAYKGFLPIDYYPALAATAPTQTLQDDFAEIGRHLDLVETYCGSDSTLWMKTLSQLSSKANSLATQIAASDSFAGSIEAKALARSIVERALHESGCANPGADALSSSQSRAALARSKATVEAIVTLDNALRNSTNGPLFHQFSTYPNYLWLRNETVPTDVILVGSSQVGAGLDVKALNQQFDLEFGSVQLPGGLAEVQQWWIPEVTNLVNPKTVVWFVGPLDLFTGCDVGGRKAQYVANHQARSKTFNRNGWLGDYDALDRIIGPRSPDETVRGDAPKRVGRDSQGLKTQRSQYTSDFNSFCAGRAQLMQQQIVELRAENREVIIVGMPVHPELTASRQGGQPAVTTEMADFAKRYLTGAKFIDLTATMQTSEPWSDLTHMTQPGSVQFTDHVIDHLYANGIR